MRRRFPNPFDRRPLTSLLVVAFLFLALCLIASNLMAADAPVPVAAIEATADAPAVAQPDPHTSSPIGFLIVGAGMLTLAAFATTQFGTTSGYWDVAANWSNGVPTSILSAIVSSTSGLCILPASTSAVTANLTGGGTLGICGGNLNKLKIVGPSANTIARFASVDYVEHGATGSDTPRGHG